MSDGNASQAIGSVAEVGQAVELAQQTQLLQALLAAIRTVEISVHDGRGRELVLEQFPAAGAKRILVYRTGNGFDSFAVPTAPGALVLPANEGRFGCQFQNTGATAIVLYLSERQQAGVPAVWLAPNGGAWNGMFGRMAWCGNVTAVAITSASTLVGGEI